MPARPLIRGLSLLTILAAIALAVFAAQRAAHNPQTDATEVSAPVIRIATIVPGRLVAVAVENNQAIVKGDVLVRVDPEPYALELAQAQAALITAQSELAQGGHSLELERSNAQVAASQIDWVRTARRVPVKIELIDPPQALTRVGLSASARVKGTAGSGE